MAQVTLKSMAGGDDWTGDSGWFARALLLAEAYGWNPTRSKGPNAPTPLIHWRYGWQEAGSILPVDAHALAQALDSAREDVRAEAPLAAPPGETAGDETALPSTQRVLTAFSDPADIRALATLASFCGRGEFMVLWPRSARA